LDFY